MHSRFLIVYAVYILMFVVTWPTLVIFGFTSIISLEYFLESLRESFLLGLILIFPVGLSLIYIGVLVGIILGIHYYLLSKTFDNIQREYAIENWSQLKSPCILFGGVSAIICAWLFFADFLPIIELFPKVKEEQEVNKISDGIYNHPFVLVIIMMSINFLALIMQKRIFD